MDSVTIVPHFLSINSGLLIVLAVFVIVGVLVKLWISLQRLPTDADLEAFRELVRRRELEERDGESD